MFAQVLLGSSLSFGDMLWEFDPIFRGSIFNLIVNSSKLLSTFFKLSLTCRLKGTFFVHIIIMIIIVNCRI